MWLPVLLSSLALEKSCSRFTCVRSKVLQFSNLAILVVCYCYTPLQAAVALPRSSLDSDIASASLSQLLDLNITTVSRMPESLGKAAAAAFVLSGEEIRRSGARSLPEALRLIPGVNVARTDSSKWAVSIRGFNSRAANKLLVMIDGRTIYDPLFSGVLWETKDTFLEDIERIEVVRGPGGSAWGANAVNGIINIITKSAKDTQGGFVVAGGGSEEQGFGDARVGTKIGETSYLRTYGKYYRRDEGHILGGAIDDSYSGMGGFRMDDINANGQRVTLQGSFTHGDHDGVRLENDVDNEEAVLQGEWEDKLSESSALNVNAYYTNNDFSSRQLSIERNTAELNVVHYIKALERLDISSGLQIRVTSDDVDGSLENITLDPKSRSDTLAGVFLQGKYALIPDELDLRLGGKLEHNDYSGSEFQPDVGLSWTPSSGHLVWGSISRAVRTPSRLENDFIFVSSVQQATLFSNRDLNAEELIAYQVGYRADLFPETLPNLYFDAASFYNHYNRLILIDGPTLQNSAHGDTYGIELFTSYVPQSWWHAKVGLSLLQTALVADENAMPNSAISVQGIEGNSPEHQTFASAGFNFTPAWQADVTVRYVDGLSSPKVSSYTVADIRLAWQATSSLEFSVVGQNLFHSDHFEQGGINASAVEPGVYGQVRWEF